MTIRATVNDANNALAYAGLVVAATIYGGWALVAHSAMASGVSPLIFASYRCLSGTVLLVLMVALRPEERPTLSMVKRDIHLFLGLGIFMSCNIAGFMLAASFVSALSCSIFQPTITVVTALLSACMGLERLTPTKFCSVLCSVAGAVVVVVFGGSRISARNDPNSSNAILGTVCLLVNVFFAALYFSCQKRVLSTYDPVFTTCATYIVASVILVSFAVCLHGWSWAEWSMGGSWELWAAALYAGALATALNYSILAWANSKLSPTIATISAPLQPLMAALLSWSVLGVKLTSAEVVGGCCILLGLFFYAMAQQAEESRIEKKRLLVGKPEMPTAYL